MQIHIFCQNSRPPKPKKAMFRSIRNGIKRAIFGIWLYLYMWEKEAFVMGYVSEISFNCGSCVKSCDDKTRNQDFCQFWPVLAKSHHGPAVSRFLVSNGSTNGAGCLRGLLRLNKTHFENISGGPFWDRDPTYPSGVPWDQKFCFKKFLMESYLGLSS